MSEWISVDERLPAEGETVIILARYDDMSSVGCVGSDGNWYDELDRDRYGDPANLRDYVTHWMPLPKPPKEID